MVLWHSQSSHNSSMLEMPLWQAYCVQKGHNFKFTPFSAFSCTHSSLQSSCLRSSVDNKLVYIQYKWCISFKHINTHMPNPCSGLVFSYLLSHATGLFQVWTEAMRWCWTVQTVQAGKECQTCKGRLTQMLTEADDHQIQIADDTCCMQTSVLA